MAGLPIFNRRPGWMKGATALTTRWLESTLEVARWENMRRAGRRWGWWGAGVGAALGVVAYAPAPWLAQAVVVATDGKLLLADSKGTIWRGDAVAVLTGGRGSRDARALPGRLNWSMQLGLRGLSLVLQQDCCMPTPVVLSFKPAWSAMELKVALQPSEDLPLQSSGQIGQWPAAWLGGLGTPWNTVQLQGTLALRTQGLHPVFARAERYHCILLRRQPQTVHVCRLHSRRRHYTDAGKHGTPPSCSHCCLLRCCMQSLAPWSTIAIAIL